MAVDAGVKADKKKDKKEKDDTKAHKDKKEDHKEKKEKKKDKDTSGKDKDKESKSKDSKSKDKSKDVSDKKDKKDRPDSGKTSRPTSASQPASKPRPAPRQMAAPAQPKKANDSYLGDIDLPPSDESDDEFGKLVHDSDEEQQELALKTDKDDKKLVDKQRKAMEKALQAKMEALKDTDDVFDVAFEGMGTDAAVVAATASDVKVHNLTVRAKGKVLLENTQLTIAAGRRYGLIGPNGKGKSTLLRLLARRQIPVPDNIDVLLVEQEVVADDRTALQAVVEADVRLMELRAEAAEIEDKMKDSAPGNDGDELGHRLTEVYEEMEHIGHSTAEARASRILHGLGFTTGMQKRATKSFSGGWRMRISLARALYIQPTLLLLDEPTNHLDLRAVLWLEEYLCRWKKTLIVVSHDRDFLNSITTDIIHLHDLKLHPYRGNFAQFEEMYEQRRREVNKQFEKFEKQMKAAKASGSKANQAKVKQNAQKEAGRKAGKGGPNKYADDAGPSDTPRRWNDYTVHFEFPEPTALQAAQLLMLNDVDFKYEGRDDFAMSNLNLGIDIGSKIAIVGPNGSGKSTLMNLIAGDLTPSAGESRRPRELRIGRYAQHFVDALQMNDTPVEYLQSKFPTLGLTATDFRGKLGKFGLSGHHHLQPICKLSGGQKARVVFTAIALANPHILLLDEPTNHLDMQSIDALCDAVSNFEGGVVVISHDSQLLSYLCSDEERSEVWVVDDGTVKKYNGDFEDYKNELISEIRAELEDDA